MLNYSPIFRCDGIWGKERERERRLILHSEEGDVTEEQLERRSAEKKFKRFIIREG